MYYCVGVYVNTGYNNVLSKDVAGTVNGLPTDSDAAVYLSETRALLRLTFAPASGLPCDGGSNCPGTVFTDMPAKDHWAHDPIDWAIVSGVTGGTSPTTFSPNATCTRAQVVTFLYSAAGKPALVGDGAHDVPQNTSLFEGGGTRSVTEGENPFVDVAGSAYYHNAVLWAYSKGITGGVDATHFGPNKTCTRAQVVTFLYSWKGRPAYTTTVNPFNDVKAADYYYNAVLWAVENGVTGGTSPTTFGPNKSCTRAQVVTFLYKAK